LPRGPTRRGKGGREIVPADRIEYDIEAFTGGQPIDIGFDLLIARR
jgi:hypothetical protein